MSRLPRGRNDARLVYADEVGGGTTFRGRGGRLVGVVEVLKDRWHARTGAWASWE